MSLDQWISSFLLSRGLHEPDGRSLFAYKTSSVEFDALRQLLCDQRFVGGACFAQGWILFASEWWKREYSGGAWRWEPLLVASGQSNLSHESIKQLVINGHKKWRLQTAIGGEGKRYIGVVAANGGLPMRLVEAAQGGLSRLVRMVIEQALRFKLPPERFRQAIEAQAALLPSCYRQLPIYELLENLIQAVLHIRHTYQLQDAKDPIVKLQEQCPNWEALFPITLDGPAVTSLIKGLVKGAAGISIKSRQTPFQIQRGLRFNSDGSTPVFEISFHLQAQVGCNAFAEALGVAEQGLPPHFQLLLRIGGQEFLVGEALLRGDEYQLIARPLPAIQTFHTEVQLIASRWGATFHVTNLVGGVALCRDEPLVFENSYPFARLLAQGDAVVKGQSALVVVPAKAVVFAEEGDVRQLNNCLEDESVLLELGEGNTRFVYRGQSFTVTVNAIATTYPEACWQGKTIEAPSSPALLFKEVPRLRIDQVLGGMGYAPLHELYIRTESGELPLGQVKAPGLCRLVWRRDGQRLLSTRAVILSESASIAYIPGKNAFEGIIQLINWPNISVRCETEGVEVSKKHDGINLNVYLKCVAVTPFTSVSICLQWPAGEQKLTLPFPCDGATLIKNGELLKAKQSLRLEELIGCRALLMSAKGGDNWRVRLSSIEFDGRSSLSQEIFYSGIREIRLFELIPVIRQMLSCHPGLDHFINLEFVHSHQTKACLQVGRYSTSICLHAQRQMASLDNNGRDLILDCKQAEGLLLALPLAEPGFDPVSLPLHFSEQVFTGNWIVNLPENIAGPWLAYANEDSAFHARPAVVQTVRAPKNLTPLAQALCESNTELRMRSLRAALQYMAVNVHHHDWLTLETLLDKLHHLPLASLDVFQALILEPEALVMATLLLDNFASRMAERFPSELPFEWLLVAPDNWLKAFSLLKEQLVSEDDISIKAIRNDVRNKSQYLSQWQPALAFIFEQGIHLHFGGNSKEVNLFLQSPLLVIDSWLKNIFGDERFPDYEPEIQKLFHRNHHLDDRQWRYLINVNIQSFLKTEHGQALLVYSRLTSDDIKLGIVMLPFVVAFDVCAGNFESWQRDTKRLFNLRKARQFDSVWFDAAYQVGLTMAQANSMD